MRQCEFFFSLNFSTFTFVISWRVTVAKKILKMTIPFHTPLKRDSNGRFETMWASTMRSEFFFIFLLYQIIHIARQIVPKNSIGKSDCYSVDYAASLTSIVRSSQFAGLLEWSFQSQLIWGNAVWDVLHLRVSSLRIELGSTPNQNCWPSSHRSTHPSSPPHRLEAFTLAWAGFHGRPVWS